MIDHIQISVSNLKLSKAFYKKALAPLGFKASPEFTSGTSNTKAVAFSLTSLEFFIAQGPLMMPPNHVSFRVTSRTQVKAFHKAALSAGGRNNGKPKIYPEYHKNYFGAYILDLDGHNIEAVCHEAE